FLEFFVEPLAHEHDVRNASAHVNGKKMLVQDARDYAVQQAGFYCNTLRSITLPVPFLTVPGRAFHLIAGDDFLTSLDSFCKLLDDQPNVIEPLFLAELKRGKHRILVCIPEPFLYDLICALPQYR